MQTTSLLGRRMRPKRFVTVPENLTPHALLYSLSPLLSLFHTHTHTHTHTYTHTRTHAHSLADAYYVIFLTHICTPFCPCIWPSSSPRPPFVVQEGPPLTVFDVNFLAPKLGINVREREGDGVVVVATIAGDIDPSILAKLKPGDVIHALNDESIKDRGISSREDIIKAIKDTPTRPLKISFIRESDSTSASASTSFSEEVPEAEVTVDKVVEDDGTPRQAGDDAAAEDEDAGETDHAVSKLAMAKDETQEEELKVSDGV